MKAAIFEKLPHLIADFDQTVSHHRLDSYTYGIEVVLSDAAANRAATKEEIDILSERLRNFTCSAHLPFYDLNMGGNDEKIRKYSKETIIEALGIASDLGIKRAVSHTGFTPLLPAKARKKWFDRFMHGKHEIEEAANRLGVSIAWENTYEPDFTLFDMILEKDPETPICLDIGHANCFSSFTPVSFLERYGKSIVHVHAHDNAGSEDSHIAIGEGSIDFNALFSRLGETSAEMVVFELTKENFLKSLEKIENLRKYYLSNTI